MEAGEPPAVSGDDAVDDATVARKRSRRVSFADTTAVHVFLRDEDYETPPESSDQHTVSPSSTAASEESPDPASGTGDDVATDEDEPEVDAVVKFVRQITVDSSSPGSVTGSVASNDDDNFFGPVSRSFICTGRPSDSGMSEDDNHDITLDSQTFSLHYKSIVQPDDRSANSAGSFLTPSGNSVASDSSEPSQAKKIIARTNFSGGGSDSNRDGLTDMSLVTKNVGSHEYGKLSPGMVDLFDKVNQSLQSASPETCKRSGSPKIGSTFCSPKTGSRSGLQKIGSRSGSPKTGSRSEEFAQFSNGSVDNQELGILEKDIDHTTYCGDHSTKAQRSTDVVNVVNIGLDTFKLKQENCLNNNCKDVIEPRSTDTLIAYSGTCALQSPSHCPLKQSDLLDPLLSGNETNTMDQSYGSSPQATAAFSSSLLTEGQQQHIQQKRNHQVEYLPETPKSMIKSLQSPQGSVSSLRAKRRQLFDTAARLDNKSSNTHLDDQTSLETELSRHSQRISAIKERIFKAKLPLSPGANNGRSLLNNHVKQNFKEMDSSVIADSSVSLPTLVVQESNLALLNSSVRIDQFSLPVGGENSSQHLNLSGRKRNIEESNDAEQGHIGKLMRAQPTISSPNWLSHMCKISAKVAVINSETHVSPCEPSKSDVSKMVSVFSEALMNLFTASNCNFEKLQIDLLEDRLENLQMAQKFKELSSSVRCKDQDGLKNQRLSSVKALQEKLLSEKAKRQLNLLRLDALNERYNRLESMRAELESSSQKADNLKKSLEACRKMNGCLTCDDVITVSNEHLEMRRKCRAIHQDAWLCEISEIISRGKRHEIVLDYLGLVTQRIALHAGSTVSIAVSNALNEDNIKKRFKNMNACTAFCFISKLKGNLKVDNMRIMQKMTTETSLLLGNLIDVVEELEAAKMELLNLTSAAFDSHSCNTSGQLVLHLCFMNFKIAKKVVLDVDMTGLSHALYQSPSELQIEICRSQTTMAPAVVNAITDAVQNLTPGRPTLLRLCRTISKIVHSA